MNEDNFDDISLTKPVEVESQVVISKLMEDLKIARKLERQQCAVEADKQIKELTAEEEG